MGAANNFRHDPLKASSGVVTLELHHDDPAGLDTPARTTPIKLTLEHCGLSEIEINR